MQSFPFNGVTNRIYSDALVAPARNPNRFSKFKPIGILNLVILNSVNKRPFFKFYSNLSIHTLPEDQQGRSCTIVTFTHKLLFLNFGAFDIFKLVTVTFGLALLFFLKSLE